MFKAIANWFKGLFGKAEQQVAKDKQINDSFQAWTEIVEMAKAQEKSYPVVAEESVAPAPAPAKKSTSRKSTTKPASKTTAKTTAKTTKTSAKTSKAPAQKAAPKSKTTKTTK